MRMKAITALALICFLALTGCSQSSADTATNKIADCKLTEREQQLVDLVGGDQSVILVEYSAQEPSRGLELRLELYMDGELIDTALALGLGDDAMPRTGLIALTTGSEQWTVSVSDDRGARYTQSAIPTAILDGYAVAYGGPGEGIEFEVGDEVVMAARLYNENGISVGELAELADPANLEGYAYALVLKGRLTMEWPVELEQDTSPEESSAPEEISEPVEESPEPVEESSAAAESSVASLPPSTQAEVLSALAGSVAYDKETGELALTIPQELESISDRLYLYVTGRVRMGDSYRSWHAFELESERGSWKPGKTYTTYVELWQIDFLEVTMSFLPQESDGEAMNDTIVVQVDDKGDLRVIVPKST